MDYELHRGDCLSGMAKLETGSVQLIATDPPYFRVKDDEWDNQWANADAFLQWMDALCQEWRRVLAPNGSLYVFASPQMARPIANVIERHFRVLNEIKWVKTSTDTETNNGPWSRASKEALRAYFPQTESVIFAEHYGADSMAMGEAGYAAKCEKLRGFVFEPLRAYLDGERQKAGVGIVQIVRWFEAQRLPKYVVARHSFSTSQWELPTESNYNALRRCFTELSPCGDYLRREYEDLCREYEDLRREYEDLRREYEDLRRPFYATPDAPYTDVWTFPTVNAYSGKHPAEKPLELMRHIVKVSSCPGDLVLDCFAGSGTTGHAAGVEGRRFVGFEKDARWHAKAQKRTAAAYGDWQTAQQTAHVTDTGNHDDLPLFAEAHP